MNEMIDSLNRVLFTMNQLEVRGLDNMDKILGIKMTVEAVRNSLMAKQEEEEANA